MKNLIVPYLTTIQIKDQDGNFSDCIAKFDSGADNCSLDETLAAKLGLDSKEIAQAKIMNANGVDERPVVSIEFKINNTLIKTFASLADRSKLDCLFLIGRSALQSVKDYRFLIDIQKLSFQLRKIAFSLQGDM